MLTKTKISMLAAIVGLYCSASADEVLNDAARDTLLEQKSFLEEQNFFAQKKYDKELEKTALYKLSLILDRRSPYYRLLEIQHRIREGGKSRESAYEDIEILCSESGSDYECREAKEFYSVTDSAMRVRLQPFFMHETNGAWELAVKDLEDIYSGPPLEDNLRLRYFLAMGNIEGREYEAVKGIDNLLATASKNTYLTKKAQAERHNILASGYANEGLRLIKDAKTEAMGIAKIKQAIETAPEHADRPYWEKRLKQESSYAILGKADAALAKGDVAAAIRYCNEGAVAMPNSPYPYTTLARIYATQGNAAMFRQSAAKAVSLAKNESESEAARIAGQMKSLEADLIVAEAKRAEESGNAEKAIKLYKQACAADPQNAWLRYRTAAMIAEHGGTASDGLSFFEAAGAKLLSSKAYADPYSLLLVKNGLPHKAKEVLAKHASKDANLKNRLNDLETSMKVEALAEAADKAAKSGDIQAAIKDRLAIAKLRPQDPWNLLDLGRLYAKSGDAESAKEVFFRYGGADKGTNEEFLYAEVLLLCELDEYDAAESKVKAFMNRNVNLAAADSKKDSKKTEKAAAEPTAYEIERESYKRAGFTGTAAKAEAYVAEQKTLHEAQVLRAEGKTEAAYQKLSSANSPSYSKTLADWLLEDGKPEESYAVRRSILDNEKNYEDLSAGFLADTARNAHRLGMDKDALEYLKKAEQKADSSSASDISALADAYGEMGMQEQEANIFERETVSPNGAGDRQYALFLRKKADFYDSVGRREESDALYKTAVANLRGIDSALYADDSLYTRDLRTPDEDADWLSSSLRSRAEKNYKYRHPVLTVAYKGYRDSGHSGYSDAYGHNVLASVDFGLLGGMAKFQVDTYALSEGHLSGMTYEDRYGSCYETGCSENKHKFVNPLFNFSWTGETFHFDIGTAPKIKRDSNKGSYAPIDLVGSFGGNFDLFGFSADLTAYRRAKINSLLSYHGDYDPLTGIAYGAVKALGAQLSLSRARTKDDGFWGSLSYEHLSGTNVESNNAFKAIAGWYYHVLNKPNEQVTLVPSVMYWHFDKNLSEYFLGHGGYFSPQNYLSAGLSAAWRKRLDDWSWEIKGSASWSRSSKDGGSRYPIRSLIYPDRSDRNASFSGSSDSSFGYAIEGSLERRITDSLVLGIHAKAAKGDDYSPFEAGIYFRYTFGGFNGDLPMGPLVPVPQQEW